MAAQTNQPCLTVLGGDLAGTRFVIEDDVENILIGSDPSCTFRLDLEAVSPIHARVWRDATGVTVYDTHSPKGLFVNDDRVNGQAPLRNGDILWLGSPGDETVVMIQCRLPAPTTAAAVNDEPEPEPEPTVAFAPEPAVVEPEYTGDEPTVFLPAEPQVEAVAEPEPEPTMALPPSDYAVEPTVMTSANDVPPPVPASSESFFVEDEPFVPPVPPPPAPDEDDIPTRFTVEPPASLRSQDPGGSPAFFEDETMETLSDVPAFARPQAPPPAAPPPVFEEAEPEPAPEPPPTLPPAPTIRVAPPTPPPVPAVPRPPAAAAATSTARRAVPPAVSRSPRPAAAAPAPRPRSAAPSSGGGGGKGVLLGGLAVGGLALVALGGGAYYWFVLKPGSTQTSAAVTPAPVVATPVVTPPPAVTEPPAVPSAEVTTAPTEAATEAPSAAPTAPSVAPSAATPSPAGPRATPTPTKTPKGTPAPTTAKESPETQRLQQVALVLGQAEQAAAAQQWDTAVGRYDEVLRLDPQNGAATAGRAKAAGIRDSLKRRFLPGTSVVQSAKGSKGGDLSGFESSDVKVAKAPDYSGRLDFEVSPANVKPGDAYTVKIFFTNDGKKSFKIGTLTVTTTANGSTTGGPAAGRGREIASQDRVALDQVPGVWAEGVTSWRMEVIVTSTGGDSVKNQLVWK